MSTAAFSFGHVQRRTKATFVGDLALINSTGDSTASSTFGQPKRRPNSTPKATSDHPGAGIDSTNAAKLARPSDDLDATFAGTGAASIPASTTHQLHFRPN